MEIQPRSHGRLLKECFFPTVLFDRFPASFISAVKTSAGVTNSSSEHHELVSYTARTSADPAQTLLELTDAKRCVSAEILRLRTRKWHHTEKKCREKPGSAFISSATQRDVIQQSNNISIRFQRCHSLHK